MVEIVKILLGNMEYPHSQILTMMNGVLEEWSKYFPDVYYAMATDTLSADADTITIPATMVRFDRLELGDYEYKLIPQADLRYHHATSDSICYYDGTNIRVRPAASADVTYYLYYYEAVTTISALTETYEIPAEWHRKMAEYTAAGIKGDFVVQQHILEQLKDRLYKFNPEETFRCWKDEYDNSKTVQYE